MSAMFDNSDERLTTITVRSLKKAILPLLILLVGTGLRFHGLARDARFHPDEALYNTFARDAAVYGDWLFARPLDKPPLMLYANALSMAARRLNCSRM